MLVPMSADVETTVYIRSSHRPTSVPMLQALGLKRNSHRPISVPMLWNASPDFSLPGFTSADIGTDVYQLDRSLQDDHIGRCRCRCEPAASIAPGLPHRPMSVPMCASWIDLSRITTSADVGADVNQLHRIAPGLRSLFCGIGALQKRLPCSRVAAQTGHFLAWTTGAFWKPIFLNCSSSLF